MSTRENIRLIARGPLNKLGSGPLGDANTKYQDSRPCGFRQDFFMFSL